MYTNAHPRTDAWGEIWQAPPRGSQGHDVHVENHITEQISAFIYHPTLGGESEQKDPRNNPHVHGKHTQEYTLHSQRTTRAAHQRNQST